MAILFLMTKLRDIKRQLGMSVSGTHTTSERKLLEPTSSNGHVISTNDDVNIVHPELVSADPQKPVQKAHGERPDVRNLGKTFFAP